MILKKVVTAVIFFLTWIDGNFGASYSKVYVNSGSNDGTYQYVGYGAPPVAYGAPTAQLSAPPAGSALPYARAASFVTPCVSPCIPQQPIAQIANAGLVAYTAPRAPVVVARDAPPNYEYSYVVYDDGTGDQKAARELSDGGVVQGQYSFLQPDGYVREVQYTADDVTGFNAVVNYLPASGEKNVNVKEVKPCPEVKSEALKMSEDKTDTKKIPEVSKSAEIQKAPKSDEVPAKETSAEKKSAELEVVRTEVPVAAVPVPEVPAAKVPVANAPKTPLVEAPPPEISTSQTDSKEGKQAPKTSTSQDPCVKVVGSSEDLRTVEISVPKKTAKSAEPKPDISTETDPSGETISAEVTEVKPVAEESIKAPVPTIVSNTLPFGYVSYDQLLKCIQKMQNTQLSVNSPLTYILLPKPC